MEEISSCKVHVQIDVAIKYIPHLVVHGKFSIGCLWPVSALFQINLKSVYEVLLLIQL